MENQLSGVELIAKEREEQKGKHNRSVAYDVAQNTKGELAAAAQALITGDYKFFPKHWNEVLCTKMIAKTKVERLIIAGALLAAEVDRINEGS